MILGLSLASPAAAGDGNLGKPVDFANAGIQVAFPRMFEPAVALQAACLATRVEKDGNDWKKICTLNALPILDANRFPGEEKMAGSVVDDIVRSRGNVISDRLSSAETKVQDRPGWRLTARLTDPQKAQEIDVVSVWSTEGAPGRPAFCFLVLVRSRGGDANAGEAAARAVCCSAKAIPLVPADRMDISALGAVVESKDQGFAFRIPEGWHVSQAGKKADGSSQLIAGATDYSRGGQIPNFGVVVTPVAGEYPKVDQALADRASEDVKRARADMKYTPLSARVGQLAGQPAVELTGALETGGLQITQAARQVYRGGRTYSLTMTVLGKDEKRALDLLDKITAEFRLMGAGATR